MKTETLRALSQLWDTWEALPPDERPAWLAALHARDPELARHLENSIGSTESKELSTSVRRTKLLEGLPHTALKDTAAPAITTSSHQVADRIGPYRLEQLLGRGGLGEVWRASREDGGLRRSVALKIPLWADVSPVQRWRFEQERDILAGLVHPHIARLYDAGVTEKGQPYLVMEAVEGVHLTRWVREQGLSLGARVDLLLKVADAVQHAHSQLVIHRDIKPSNILVKADGEPMLLDFGIGKLLEDGGLAPASDMTRMAAPALTPDYAAPEQLLNEPVSTATDVYALGVVLHELLCGQRPLQGLEHTEVLRAALDGAELPPPSKRVTAEAAQAMGLDLKAAARALRGDLDTIVRKATQRLPGQRYPTVYAFMEDLRRWQSGEPVLAMPQRWSYRASRFVRRHRWPVAAAAGVLLSVAAGLGTTLWQAEQTRKEAEVAKATEQFLTEMLNVASARGTDAGKKQELTLRELLDRGTERLMSETTLDAPIRIRLMTTLRTIYYDMGAAKPAHELQRKITDLRRESLTRLDPLHAQDLIHLTSSGNLFEKREQREAWRSEAERILDELGDHSSLVRGELLLVKTISNLGDRRACVELVEPTIALLRKHPPGRMMAESLLIKANCLTDIARAQEAVVAAEESEKISRTIQDQTKLRTVLGFKARALNELDRSLEAMPLAEEGLQRTQAARTPEQPPSLAELLAAQALSEVQRGAGQLPQALETLHAVLAAAERTPDGVERNALGGVLSRVYALQARWLAESGDTQGNAQALQAGVKWLSARTPQNNRTRLVESLASAQWAADQPEAARCTLSSAQSLFTGIRAEGTVPHRGVVRTQFRLALQDRDWPLAERRLQDWMDLVPEGPKDALLRTGAEGALLQLELLAAQGRWADLQSRASTLAQRLSPSAPFTAETQRSLQVWQAVAALQMARAGTGSGGQGSALERSLETALLAWEQAHPREPSRWAAAAWKLLDTPRARERLAFHQQGLQRWAAALPSLCTTTPAGPAKAL